MSNRREFLKASTGAVAALSLPSLLQREPGESPPVQTAGRSDGWSQSKRIPSQLISLPKSGAVQGVGETFLPDPQTGTEGIAVPLPLSRSADRLSPQLSLNYSVANGNGPFGMGWKLTLPEVARKTQNKLPQYTDDDVFLLNGAELRLSGRAQRGPFRVDSFHLRHESSFARIEHWVRESRFLRPMTRSFWCVTSSDNVTEVFGATEEAILADPGRADHVLRWDLQLGYDGKGNLIHYRQKREDAVGAPTYERGRAVAQAFLKRIRYGNLTPVHFHQPDLAARWLVDGGTQTEFFFEAVLDYGEHAETDGDDAIVSEACHQELQAWPARPDAFSSHRGGFEVRTRRTCRRVLMFHRLPDVGRPVLIGSLDLLFQPPSAGAPIALLDSVIRRGYAPAGDAGSWNASEDYVPGKKVGVRSRSHFIASTPPLQFRYSDFVAGTAADIIALAGERPDLDDRLGEGNHGLVDLFQRGIPDVLETRSEQYFYRRNLGVRPDGRAIAFGARTPLAPTPGGESPTGSVVLARTEVGFADLDGDGFPDLLIGGVQKDGYCLGTPRTAEHGEPRWHDFRPFPGPDRLPFRFSDANIQLLDLTGDGRLDVLRFTVSATKQPILEFFESLGAGGFASPFVRPVPEDFPRLGFHDPRLRFADMNGDGLTDIVLIDSGQVQYWPSLGRGYFGTRIVMENSPSITGDRARLYLADVDGSGPADMMYVGSREVQFWLNHNGNAWGETRVVPVSDMSLDRPQVLDLVGSGMNGLLLSRAQLTNCRFLPLAKSKPFMLTSVSNNLGRRVEYEYVSSTTLALHAEARGTPWSERLPFPVHVLGKVTRFDDVANSKLVSTFNYAHGFYDGEEKEFKGFGRVEQLDTEQFSPAALFPAGTEAVTAESHQPPVRTVSWFQTGRYVPPSDGSAPRYYDGLHRGEYYAGDEQAPSLRGSELPPGLSEPLAREAVRTLAGRLIRREVYALDGGAREAHPYVVTEHSFVVRQAPVFFAHDDQTLELRYERDPTDPQVSHQLVLSVDEFGHVTESAAIAYPRRSAMVEHPDQGQTHATSLSRRYCPAILEPQGFRHGVVYEERKFELVGLSAPERCLPRKAPCILARATIREVVSRRLFEHTQTHFWQDDGAAVLPYGRTGLRALVHHHNRLALTPELVRATYGARVTNDLAQTAGYFVDEHGWWVPSGHTTQGEHVYDTQHFCLPVKWIDPFGNLLLGKYDANWQGVVETRDALANVTTAEFDYRVLLPRLIEDANGNRTEFAFDALGRLTATAIMGKRGEAVGDSLTGIDPYLSYDAIVAHASDPLRRGRDVLGRATSRVLYDPWRSFMARRPRAAIVYTVAREQHAADGRLQHSVVYSDGSGREIQTKKLVAQARWVASGSRVYDNKGNVIKQYEPLFTTTHELELDPALTKSGAVTRFRYDPTGRVVRTDLPDGTHTRVTFTAWREDTHDQNDSVLDSDWYRGPSTDPAHARAKQLAAAHANTPSRVHVDPLRRPFLTTADNGPGGSYSTRSRLDIQGNVVTVTDARGHQALVTEYDLLQRVLRTRSIDAGERLTLPDAGNKPIRSWDGAGHEIQRGYDALHRPTETHVRTPAGAERLVERVLYGESLADAPERNLRGMPHRHFDEAGVVTNEQCDFKGNVVQSVREYWASGSALEDDKLSQQTTFDALNRPVTTTYDDGTAVANDYDQGGNTQRVRVRVSAAADFEAHVADSRYNARGQCVEVLYGNGVRTTNTYDPQSFRLARSRSVGRDGALLQDLTYTYDPVGNVVETTDTVPATVFSRDQQLPARTRFTYDAVYRLISTEGREHRGQMACHPQLHDSVPLARCHPNDGTALRTYTQAFRYDEVGNLRAVEHTAEDGGWTKEYAYIPGTNRLLTARVRSDRAELSTYSYDENGNIKRGPKLDLLSWDYVNRLIGVRVGNVEGSYGYDAAGLRVRKIVRRDGNVDDRLTFGDMDLLRVGTTERRRTLHVNWNTRRVSSVEWADRTGARLAAARVTRYALGNQLGSVQAETDETGRLMTYEEYHPFGTSSYRFAPHAEEAKRKRFRFVGKELDEESGLYYFGARYYAAWLGRWTSPDPIGLKDGPNPFAYVGNNPVKFTDANGLQRDDEDRPKRPPDSEMEKLEENHYWDPKKDRSWMDLEGATIEGNALKEDTKEEEKEKGETQPQETKGPTDQGNETRQPAPESPGASRPESAPASSGQDPAKRGSEPPKDAPYYVGRGISFTFPPATPDTPNPNPSLEGRVFRQEDGTNYEVRPTIGPYKGVARVRVDDDGKRSYKVALERQVVGRLFAGAGTTLDHDFIVQQLRGARYHGDYVRRIGNIVGRALFNIEGRVSLSFEGGGAGLRVTREAVRAHLEIKRGIFYRVGKVLYRFPQRPYNPGPEPRTGRYTRG